MFWVGLPLFVGLSLAIAGGRAGGAALGAGGFSAIAFATQVASAASFNITGAPYVSDYTRYLPRRTRPSAIIASVFFGSGSSAFWLIVLGAWLATHFNLTDGLVALRRSGDVAAPGFGSVLAAASIGGLLATIAMSAYSAMLTAFAMIDCLRPLVPGKGAKAAMLIALAAAWLAIALAARGDAIVWVNALLIIILYGLAPWSAVNLIDYFWLRRGVYSVRDIFDPKGGYGVWNRRGLGAYFAGFVASLPFFVAPGLYIAPIAQRLGGVDIGWLVSLAVSSLTYIALSRSARTRRAGDVG